MKNDFLIAITQVCAERHLSKEVVLAAIEQALVLAYKRNFGSNQNIEVRIDPNTGRARVFADKEVVDVVSDQNAQIATADARRLDPMAQVGAIVKIEETPGNFGRITAQTAKQVILQRIREAERDTLYADWSDRVGEDILGVVRNIDSTGNVILSMGRAEAIMPKSEQIGSEHYTPNQRLRTYIYEVEKTSRGPRIRVSRTHHRLLRRLLETEVPEVYQGSVEIKSIAREPGSRSKVAVAATQPGIDPVGSCVGVRGVRIQNIVNELNGEKIDVVAWSPDESAFIANALSPAKVEHVWLDPGTKTATVVVPDTQLSLAIGKEGQNARLAAKLTGWRIDIKSNTEAAAEMKRRSEEAAAEAVRQAELAAKREAAAALLAEAERALAEEEARLAASAPHEGVQAEAISEEVATPTPSVEAQGAESTAAVQEALMEKPALPETVTPAESVSIESAAAPPTVEGIVPAWEPEEEEEVVSLEQPGKAKKKRKVTDLVYDEQTGTMVRRTTRKESRRRNEWEEEEAY